MKKSVFAGMTLLAALSSAHAECTFNNQTSDDIRATVVAAGGWPINDAKCAVLNAKKLSLSVSGQATVLDGVSVGWVTVMLTDTALNIRSDQTQKSTYVNTKRASMDLAKEIQYDAIRDAINGLDFDKAAREVDAYRAKALASGKAGTKR